MDSFKSMYFGIKVFNNSYYKLKKFRLKHKY